MGIRNRVLVWALDYITSRDIEMSRGGRRSPDFTISDDQLRRWWIFRTRWGALYLHQFNASDPTVLHDHPRASIGWIISPNGYWEVTKTGRTFKAAGSLTFRRATFAHKVVLPSTTPVYTLFFVGPIVREWGFHCPNGWKPWKECVNNTPSGNRWKGCE